MMRELLTLCGMSTGALLVGVVLSFRWVSYLPFYWAIGLVGVFGVYAVVAAALRRSTWPAVYSLVTLCYTIAFAGVFAAFTDVCEVERFECDWRMADGKIEVDLQPAGGFRWSQVDSPQFAERLREARPPKVLVDVYIVRGFGRVRARGRILSVDGFAVREP
jgi:hypothetical protein